VQIELEKTLAKLVAIPSVTGDAIACHEIFDFVHAQLQPLGLYITSSTDTPNPWLIATTQPTKKPDILLVAHLDVVPAPVELFIMRKQDGKFYGRGVYDMKFAAVCYLEFFKTHADILPGLNIGILFTTDEEGGGSCMPSILDTGLRPRVVLIPDGGDNWSVEERAKGLYVLELTVYGKTAHGSRPWEGKNALDTLLDILQTLRGHYPSTDPAGTTLSITTLRAGEAITQIPDRATATLDFRSFSKTELSEYKQRIDTLVQTHGVDAKYTHAGNPLLFDPEAPAVQSFLNALREQTGTNKIHYSQSYGASDGRYFAGYNIPCILLQPYGGGRHSESEWLEANDLEKYYQLVERWLLPAAVFSSGVHPREINVSIAS